MMPNSDYQLTAAEVYPKQKFSGFQLSPDGRWLSFLLQRDKHIKEVEEKGQQKLKEIIVADLCLLSSSGGFPHLLTNTGDVDTPGSWSLGGESLVFGRAAKLQILELNENHPGEISITRLNTICKDKLYDPKLTEAGDAYLSYPSWRPLKKDDRLVGGPHKEEFLLFATCEDKETALRAIRRDGYEQRKLHSLRGTILGWQWSPDGSRILLVTRDESRLNGHIYLLDFDSGDTIAQWEEEHYKYHLPAAAWITSGDQIVFRSNRSGWAKLWIYSLDSKANRPLTTGDWDDYSFRCSPDGQQLVFASREGNESSGTDLWVLGVEQGERRRITQHPGINSPLAWSANNQIYYWHSSSVEPDDLWVVSLHADEPSPKRLTNNAPADLVRKLRAPKAITIENGNTKIPALVYLPAYHQDDKTYPAIIWIRGGPTGTCRYEFKPLYNFLANLGFVVITPNYRGSTGCGVEHMKAVLGEGVGKNDLDDIFATEKYIREQLPGVNLARGIGIGGESWGGYLTLMAVTSKGTESQIGCAVAGAAISDWFIQQAETEVRSYDNWLMGGWVYAQKDRANERSPVNRIENIRVPLLVYHGELDRDVPFSQIKAFIEKAQKAGVPVDYKPYPAEEHNLKKPENQQDMLKRIGDFFRKHLQQWDFSDIPCGDQVL
jgi:dipeptidyl aminopeptidase/acylaminoacyl peptidase